MYPDGDTDELESAQLKDILLANMDGKTPINENIGEDLESHDFAAEKFQGGVEPVEYAPENEPTEPV